MIELIFVILILGILAAVAIPRLNATRDDASVVSALNQVDRLTKELVSLATLDNTDYTGSTGGAGRMPNQDEMVQKYSLVPDGSLYSDATIFRMKTAIDDNHAQACVGIPATVRGIRYVDTKTLFIVYGLNQTPKCKRLTQLLDKKFSNSYYCETMYQGSKMCQLNNAEGLFRH